MSETDKPGEAGTAFRGNVFETNRIGHIYLWLLFHAFFSRVVVLCRNFRGRGVNHRLPSLVAAEKILGKGGYGGSGGGEGDTRNCWTSADFED